MVDLEKIKTLNSSQCNVMRCGNICNPFLVIGWEDQAFSGDPSRADTRRWSGPWGPQGSCCMEFSIRAKRAFLASIK